MVADQIKAVFKAMKVPEELVSQIMPYISKDGSKPDEGEEKKEEETSEETCPKCGAKCE
jgi:hypothetical protein